MVGGGYMSTCWHAYNDSLDHSKFPKKKIGVIKTCWYTDTICMSCVFVGNIGGWSTHADMPTCRQYHMFHLKIREYIWVWAKQPTTRITDLLIEVNKICRQWMGQEYMPTCWHADNNSIFHSKFSNKKFSLVINTCRHADTICMSCAFVGNRGGWSNHADMPTCRQWQYCSSFNIFLKKNMGLL